MNVPLRVALLVDPLTLRSKGGEHAPELARQLLGKGHIVRGFGAPPGVIPHSGTDLEAETATDLGRGLVGFRPDVLVAYDALSPTAWWGARAARRLGAGLVLIEFGGTDRTPLHERILHGMGERLWGRYVRNTAQRVVALDPVAREQALEEGFPEASVSLLPQGVDLEHFRPGLVSGLCRQHGISGRIVLYIGRMEESRGVGTLLRAFASTVGQREDWTLVLAGEGSHRERFRAAADRLGVSSRVHFLGRPRREELPALIGVCTFLAVPAMDDGVRGKQIGRAMACGKPVLVSDLPRLRFHVEDNVTGLVVPPGDLHSWVEAMQRMASSPVARSRWGAEARKRAHERLAWSDISAQFEQVLREAAKAPPVESPQTDLGRSA